MATVTPNNNWPVPTSSDYVAQGAVAIEALGDAIDASVNTGLLAWTAYTPSFTNFTLGNGSIEFKYALLGKIVHVRGSVTLGTTSSVTGLIQVSTPATAISTHGNGVIGNALFLDAGVAQYNGTVRFQSTTGMRLDAMNNGLTYSAVTATSGTIPFTWGNTDNFAMFAIYEAA